MRGTLFCCLALDRLELIHYYFVPLTLLLNYKSIFINHISKVITYHFLHTEYQALRLSLLSFLLAVRF